MSATVKRPSELPYEEGSWFAVPLRSGGYAAGVAARLDGRGLALGYFFGPKREEVPSLEQLCTLRPEDAALVTQFGDLGILKKRWLVLGLCLDWNRDSWPMPAFVRVDLAAGNAWISTYSEHTFNLIQEKSLPLAMTSSYPPDGVDGAGAVERRLTALLGD